MPLPRVIASSVIRSGCQGERRGGLAPLDLDSERIFVAASDGICELGPCRSAEA